ncbi:hypothetical protein BH11MYX4_BH11MYX4_59470 [soil metagenome]
MSETRRLDRRLTVVQLLRDLHVKAGARRDGAARRDLLQKLASLQAAVNRWQLFAPRPEQISAMLETLLLLDDSCESRRPSRDH